MLSSIIGIIAGILCAVSFLPQVLIILKTKNTKDLSLTTFSMLSLGVFLWLIYGILIKDIPIIAANAVVFSLSLIIVGMKIKYG